MSSSEAPAVAYTVDYVTKRLLGTKGGITEIVLSVVNPKYGRVCEVSGGPVPTVPIEELARGIQEMREREKKKKKRLAEANALHKHGKWETIEEIDTALSNGGDTASTTSTSCTSHSEPASPSSSVAGNKKPKIKLETHREPITSRTRGTKRPSAFQDLFYFKKICLTS